MKLTDEQIRELCEKATEGPWEWSTISGPLECTTARDEWHPSILGIDFDVDGDAKIAISSADAEFIAASRKLAPQLLDRAQRAEAELRKCYKDIEELTAECNDLQAQVSDAGIRNAVLEKRLEAAVTALIEEAKECPTEEHRYESDQCAGHGFCEECWREWLEQEVQV